MGESVRSYLDHNATAPIRPEVAAAMAEAMTLAGNPSSMHAEGRAARARIETAREQVAGLVGAEPKNVIFTSGGTEAANLVLSPSLRRSGENGADLLIVGATEHVCALEGHRFPPEAVEHLPVSSNGIADLGWLEQRLRDAGSRRILLSLQAANNETGVIQPMGEAAHLVRDHGGLVHSDIVQAAGKIPVDMARLGADVVTLSAHKLGGPKGVGAVVLASERIEIAERLVRGGGQERGYRAGTENVAGIVGFGAAAEIAKSKLENEAARLRALRDACEAGLRRIAPGVAIFGASVERLPNTLTFAIPGIRAETALIALDLEGVAVSSGSACSSGKVRRSHVLAAMGVAPALSEGAIRVSLGWNSSEEDVNRFLRACEKIVASLYKRRAEAA
jgi:cysteine desulfurase